MKLWYHSKSGKALGANNGTSPTNAWNHLRFWTVARKFIKFVPLFLLMGCQSNAPIVHRGKIQSVIDARVAINKVESAGLTPQIQSQVVVVHQPMGYEIPQRGGTAVYITNGPSKGTGMFVADFTYPTYQTMHTGTVGKPITVQGSNDLQSWNDLYMTNAPDFYFKFDPKYLFYRTKS